MSGLRKVFIVGFSLEYHSPPSSMFLLENLHKVHVYAQIKTRYMHDSYLSVGGSSFITNHIGQIEYVEDRKIATPSVFNISKIFPGAFRNDW